MLAQDYYSVKHVKLKNKYMLRWTITFLIVAIIAAVFGFGGIAAGAASIAKVIFFLFLVLFVISLFTGSVRNR
jgi:uncharacterized membrane protein YtjA (UPF0391 family)